MDSDASPSANTAPPVADEERLPYSPPRVVLYSEEHLLQQLGPVKACSSFGPFSFPRWSSDGKRAPGIDTRYDYEYDRAPR